MLQVGDYVNTPRFLKVKIRAIYTNKKEAHKEGYCEPTHYQGDFEVLGKHTGTNRMQFAAIYK